MTLSIVIPIYNVREYIPRCLDSIFGQCATESDYEIIAVDDGSTDNSSDLIKEYQIRHHNIKLIEQSNQGVSVARNNALKECQGKYIIFVDPDDAIFESALSSLIAHINVPDAREPVIVMRSFHYDGKEDYGWTSLFKTNSEVNCIDAINKGFDRGSVCGCAFLKEFLDLNRISFPIGIRNSEDTIFFYKSMMACNTLFFLDIRFYHVIGRENSAGKTYSIERICKGVESVRLVNDWIQSEDDIIRRDFLYLLKYKLISATIYSLICVRDGHFKLLYDLGLSDMKYVKCRFITYRRTKMLIMRTSLRLFYFMSKLRHNHTK